MNAAKFAIVVILTGMAIMAGLGIGVCLWTAYVLFAFGSFKSGIAMCAMASSFIVWMGWSVLKNRGEIIRDLKGVWRGEKL
jgi:membrane protein implicated in regulation of membrane protease activity